MEKFAGKFSCAKLSSWSFQGTGFLEVMYRDMMIKIFWYSPNHVTLRVEFV